MEENKTFTQEEVNAIVQKRLAEEKSKHAKELEDMQEEVAIREKKLDAQERLKEKGLPAELVGLVNLRDEESFNSSIELIEKTYTHHEEQNNNSRTQYTPAGGEGHYEDPVRKAMGLG